ncbi:PQQ-dependent sugar dehydrogenase [Halococcus agarilyticus]|uniref:PQQ-dependent sugar dehydrogenase n=1 Tax=Halococcus agarilyticus TaxID=1232219 RepID=UPI000677C2D5|nr:PQQ-dependent sugar dehydrogenase [Halococcus agarilyticus]
MDGTNHGSPRRSAAPSRRRFLSLAAAGTLASVGGLGSAVAQSPEIIRLGGEIAGWQGRAPDSIAGETNPTLTLEAGTTYRVVWENIDGMGHNFALLDSEGTVLQRTDVMSEEGETQSVEFTAREGMAEYVCEPHITSMQGSISFGDGSSEETATETSTEDESDPYIPEGSSVRLETVADGNLVAPVDFEEPPGTSTRRFVADRLGQVYLHTDDGLRAEPYVDVSDRMAEIGGEKGLLGMAFHPEFQENGRFFLRYSAPLTDDAPDSYSHTEVLAEFSADDGSEASASFVRRLLEIPEPQDTHNAGAVTFGPDGYLYVGVGDGGGAHDNNPGHVEDWYEANEGGNGQDVRENLLGSVLRIDVDGETDDKPYGIPDDNPLVGDPGLNEQFAWGFRNPWRMGFSDGRLFVADVGQNGFEEVSIVEKDKNYGWNVREGTHCFKPGPEGSRNPPEECPSQLPPDVRGGERLIDPVIEYPHSHEGRGVGSAAIGGYVYENDGIAALEGKYVFGDFRKTAETETPTGSLFAATPTDDGLWELEELVIENRENGTVGAYVLAIGRDNDGGLYVLSSAETSEGRTGAVHRIRPPNNTGQEGTTSTAENTSANETAMANTTTADTTATAETTRNATTPTTNATTSVTTTTNATITTRPTSNATAATTTGSTETTATTSGTETTTSTATTAGSDGNATTGGVSGGSSGSGPGFGALAALSGLAIGAARLLAGDDE